MRVTIKKEKYEQSAFFDYVKIKAKTDERYNLIFAVPNGGSRHKLEAVNLKRQGLVAGIPDVLVDIPNKRYHGLRIEFKVGSNKLTTNQQKYISLYNKYRYKAVVCYSCEAAIKELEDYLNDC